MESSSSSSLAQQPSLHRKRLFRSLEVLAKLFDEKVGHHPFDLESMASSGATDEELEIMYDTFLTDYDLIENKADTQNLELIRYYINQVGYDFLLKDFSREKFNKLWSIVFSHSLFRLLEPTINKNKMFDLVEKLSKAENLGTRGFDKIMKDFGVIQEWNEKWSSLLEVCECKRDNSFFSDMFQVHTNSLSVPASKQKCEGDLCCSLILNDPTQKKEEPTQENEFSLYPSSMINSVNWDDLGKLGTQMFEKVFTKATKETAVKEGNEGVPKEDLEKNREMAGKIFGKIGEIFEATSGEENKVSSCFGEMLQALKGEGEYSNEGKSKEQIEKEKKEAVSELVEMATSSLQGGKPMEFNSDSVKTFFKLLAKE